RATGYASVAAATVVLVFGAILSARARTAHLTAGHLLRADALASVMLIVIGSVGVLATWASIDYLETERTHGQTTAAAARQYCVLVNVFVTAITLAVLDSHLGVMWVAIVATNVASAFPVAH